MTALGLSLQTHSVSEKGGCCRGTDGDHYPSLRASVTPKGGLKDEEPDEGAGWGRARGRDEAAPE